MTKILLKKKKQKKNKKKKKNKQTNKRNLYMHPLWLCCIPLSTILTSNNIYLQYLIFYDTYYAHTVYCFFFFFFFFFFVSRENEFAHVQAHRYLLNVQCVMCLDYCILWHCLCILFWACVFFLFFFCRLKLHSVFCLLFYFVLTTMTLDLRMLKNRCKVAVAVDSIHGH